MEKLVRSIPLSYYFDEFRQIGLFILLVLWSVAFSAHAQDGWLKQHTHSQFGQPNVKFDGHGLTLKDAASDWLSQYLKTVGSKGSALQLQHFRESRIGIHITYQQFYQGLPVYGSQVKLNLSKKGELLSLFHKTLDPDAIDIRLSKGVKKAFKLPALEGMTDVKQVIFKDKGAPELAMVATFTDVDKGIHDQLILSRSGDTLHQRDMNRYLGAQTDTTAKAFVFLPNPLISAEESYGKPYWDNGDQTNSALNQEREPVFIRVTKAGPDSFRLSSPLVRIAEFSAPNTPPTYSTNAIFNFFRDTAAFEDVNTFYHLQRFNDYMERIGLNEMFDYQLPVDAHALSGQDNSRFSGDPNSPKGRLFFGDGGVDDGEDADIIIHEFGHALSAYASPGSYGTNRESQALEEGLCDYLACSYGRHLSNYNWEQLFAWDAGIRPRRKNRFWEGRWCTTDKTYPSDLTGGKYEDGEIWAGTFMEVWEKLGRETTDELVLAALNSFSRNMSMDDGARLVLQADSMLFEGQHYNELVKTLSNRGLVESEQLGLPDEGQSADRWAPKAYYQDQAFVVELNRPARKLFISLQSLNGQVISERQFSGDEQLRIPAAGLASGLYILHLRKPSKSTTIKVPKP